MVVRISVALLVLLLGASIVGAVYFSTRPTTVTRSTAVSPDGLFAATLEIGDGGAGVSPSARVVLHDIKGAIGDAAIEIFDGVGGWPVALRWTGPKLMVLSFCGGSRYKARTSVVFDDPVTGNAEELTLAIVTTPAVTVNGRAYCTSPA